MRGRLSRLADLVLWPWYRWSKLDLLADRFPALKELSGPLLTGETIRLNNIKWRGVVALGVWDRGLYLQVAAASPALIPWEQVADGGPARLYGRSAHALALGLEEPVRLVVYDQLYGRIASRIA